MVIEYTLGDWPGYYGTYTLLSEYGEDGYGLTQSDIDLLEYLGLREAKKYKTRWEFEKESGGAVNTARKNGWMDEACKHMIPTKKPSGHWNDKGIVLKEARKYKTRTEFTKNAGSAYNAARKNGWMDEVYKHFKKRL